MSKTIYIDGLEGGQLTLPLHNSPLDVKVGQVGTITLGRAQQDSEYNVFPIAFSTRDLVVKIDVEDNTGRLVLSWDSSTKPAVQNDPAFPEDDIPSTVRSTGAETLPTRSTEGTTGAWDSSQPDSQSVSTVQKPSVAKRRRPRKTYAAYNTRGLRSKQPVQIAPNQRAFIIKQLGKLINVHKDSELFNDPVDTLQYPQYKNIIKRPMDFRTILRNYKNSTTHYPTVEAVMADFDLVLSNAIKYNGLMHAISQKARSTQKWFHKRMKLLPAPQDNDADTASRTAGNNMEVQQADIKEASTHPQKQNDELAPSRQSKSARTDIDGTEPVSTRQ